MKKGQKKKTIAPKVKKFLRIYANNMHRHGAIKFAAIKAGYSPKTASVQGSKILKIAKNKRYVKQLQQQAAKRSIVSIKKTLNEFANIAYLDPAEVLDEGGRSIEDMTELPVGVRKAIAGIDVITTVTKNGDVITTKKLRFANKLTALHDIALYLGMFKEKGENVSEIAVYIDNLKKEVESEVEIIQAELIRKAGAKLDDVQA